MSSKTKRRSSDRERSKKPAPEFTPSPHDYPGADIESAGPGEVLVNAPYRQYYERWLDRQERPERFRYVYRTEQLQGIHDATLLVIGGGNAQLLEPLKSAMYACIKVRILDS